MITTEGLEHRKITIQATRDSWKVLLEIAFQHGFIWYGTRTQHMPSYMGLFYYFENDNFLNLTASNELVLGSEVFFFNNNNSVEDLKTIERIQWVANLTVLDVIVNKMRKEIK